MSFKFFLFDNEVDINILDQDTGKNLLHKAIELGRTQITRILLQYPKIDFNAATNEGHTALTILASKKDLTFDEQRIVKFLINLPQTKINLNKANHHGDTPLICAAGKNNVKFLRLILAKDISVAEENNEGMSALYDTASSNAKEAAKILLTDPRIDVNQINPDNENSPLIIAAKNRNYDVLQILLRDPRTDMSRTNVPEKDAMIEAFEEGYLDIVGEILLRQQYASPSDRNLIELLLGDFVAQQAGDFGFAVNNFNELQNDEILSQKMLIVRLVREKNPTISFKAISQFFETIEKIPENTPFSSAERTEFEIRELLKIFDILKDANPDLIGDYKKISIKMDNVIQEEETIKEQTSSKLYEKWQEKLLKNTSQTKTEIEQKQKDYLQKLRQQILDLESLKNKTSFSIITRINNFVESDLEGDELSKKGYEFLTELRLLRSQEEDPKEAELRYFTKFSPEEKDQILQFLTDTEELTSSYEQKHKIPATSIIKSDTSQLSSTQNIRKG